MNSESPSTGCRWLSVKAIRRARRIPATIAARVIVASARNTSIGMSSATGRIEASSFADSIGKPIRPSRQSVCCGRSGKDYRSPADTWSASSSVIGARRSTSKMSARLQLCSRRSAPQRVRGIRERRRPRRARAASMGLREVGVFEVPSYLVNGEVYLGRQHLPLIRRCSLREPSYPSPCAGGVCFPYSLSCKGEGGAMRRVRSARGGSRAIRE